MKILSSWALAGGVWLAAAACAPAAERQPLVVAAAGIGLVQTEAGAVRGFVREGIYTYRGIPYASAARFMAPQQVAPWEGTRLALSYGNVCPQPINPQLGEPQTFIADTRFWPAAEACQNLNIWTPGVGDGKKRPVMVWLHGGGFSSGSSMELPVYDGTNLSRKGDVVVVSINHRLNVLGFIDLSAYGSAYRQSANVGMLDIVAALRWVRDNIARFGGDPANVTVFGQSGGGAKVANLLASPQARGLFQKAIIQSGAPGSGFSAYADRSVARRVAALTLREAGIADDRADALRTLPYDQLIAAADRAMDAVGKALQPSAPAPGRSGLNWSSVVDGEFLTEVPFATGAPEISRGVPLLVGSTLSEFQNLPNPQLRDREKWDEPEVRAYLQHAVGDKADQLMAAYRRAYPELAPRLWPLVDTRFRAGVLKTARQKAALGDTVYCYLFAWRSPVLDYAWAAGHSSELAFVFDNGVLGAQSSGGGAEVERLTDVISQAWINFARTGNPGHSGLAPWPAFSAQNPATMIFDSTPQVRVGHDADLIALLGH